MFRTVDAMEKKEQLQRANAFEGPHQNATFSSAVGELWELEQRLQEVRREVELRMLAAAKREGKVKVIKPVSMHRRVGGGNSVLAQLGLL